MYKRNELDTIGNRLYSLVEFTKGQLFQQGRMAQLTYQAFDKYVSDINKSEEDEIVVTYPVGYTPSKEAILSEGTYSKKELTDQYNYLGLIQLPMNGIYKLVTLIEALLTDILRTIILEYPHKLGVKKQIDASVILSSNSVQDIHLHVINKLLNELSYKTPEEFVKEFESITSINLFETNASHRYKEIKATRDIYIHNMGIANEIYLKKADTLSRAQNGQELPINIQYFLESYEYCLQLCEFLETKLNEKWSSQKYEEAQAKKDELNT